jgi:AcrR family transcriptional regulator
MKTGRRRVTRARGGGATRSAAAAAATAGTTTTAESRRQRHQREILDRLVLAARDLLFSRSLDEVRVIDLTEAADVGKGTFFNYFDSKEELLPPLVVLSISRELQAALNRVRTGQQDAWSALSQVWRTYFSPPVGDWLMYENNVLLAMVVNAGVKRQIADRVRNSEVVYDEFVRLAQQQGTFRTDLPAAALVRVLRTFFFGLTIHFWMYELSPTPRQIDEALTGLQRAIGPAPSATAGPRRRAPSTSSTPRERPRPR